MSVQEYVETFFREGYLVIRNHFDRERVDDWEELGESDPLLERDC